MYRGTSDLQVVEKNHRWKLSTATREFRGRPRFRERQNEMLSRFLYCSRENPKTETYSKKIETRRGLWVQISIEKDLEIELQDNTFSGELI